MELRPDWHGGLNQAYNSQQGRMKEIDIDSKGPEWSIMLKKNITPPLIFKNKHVTNYYTLIANNIKTTVL